MKQEQIDHITILSYLKNLSEFQARILSHLEEKTYDEILEEVVKNQLKAQKGLFEITRDNNFKNDAKSQKEINDYIKDIDNLLSK